MEHPCTAGCMEDEAPLHGRMHGGWSTPARQDAWRMEHPCTAGCMEDEAPLHGRMHDVPRLTNLPLFYCLRGLHQRHTSGLPSRRPVSLVPCVDQRAYDWP
jgi:hypothetical protein